MVRLIYAVMALALAALVTGFFVDSSSAPLFVSIVASAVVMMLILFGWSRRIRQRIDLELAEADGSAPADDELELEIVELDDDPLEEVDLPPPKRAKPKPAALRRRDAERASSTSVIEETTVIPPVRKRAASRSKPVAAKAKSKPAPAIRPAPTKRKPAAKKPSPAAKSSKVLVIPGRSKFHRRGCRFAKADDVREVSEATARKRGYEPCNVCSA